MLFAQGKVVARDTAKREITITIASENAAIFNAPKFDGTDQEKKARIAEGTVITRFLLQKDAAGEITRSSANEVNIGDLKKGAVVSIRYGSEKDGVLEDVAAISFNAESKDDIDKDISTASEAAMVYVKGGVVSVDVAKRTIAFHPYTLDKVSDRQVTATVAAGGKIYAVSNAARAQIEHARTPIRLGDIAPGDTVFFSVDKDADFSQTTIAADMILLVVDKVL